MVEYRFHVLDVETKRCYDNDSKNKEAKTVQNYQINDFRRCRGTIYSVLLSLNRMC
jgi:hypothetical protein